MEPKYKFEKGQVIYRNPLSKEEHVKDFVPEGKVIHSFHNDQLVLEHEPVVEGKNADSHWVLWNKNDFPDRIMIEWAFQPLSEPGLCMIFFAAEGKKQLDIFDEKLPERTGRYPEYHSGEINTLHLSYFRRKWEDERSFHTCNLRKSSGFHLVSQGADPIPSVQDAADSYQMKLVYYEGVVQFSVNNLTVLEWQDDGQGYGPILNKGKIGFRQMSPMRGAYSHFEVSEAVWID